jgi:hypothetical protein
MVGIPVAISKQRNSVKQEFDESAVEEKIEVREKSAAMLKGVFFRIVAYHMASTSVYYLAEH